MANNRILDTWRIGIISAVTCLLLLASTLSIAGAQQTPAGNRASSPTKAYAPSGSVRLVKQGVVDLRKQPTIKAGTQTPTQNRPIRDVKTPAQRAAYEAAVRNGSIKLPSANQTLSLVNSAQSPNFVGGGTNPLLVKNVDGLNSTQSNCGCYPPDQAIATDLSYVMEGVNTSIGIFNANTGALQFGPYSADSFFSAVKVPGDLFSDPQMNYDVMRDRWVVVMIEYPPSAATSFIDIAVSQTNSPTQPAPGAQYNVYRFTADFQGGGGHQSFCDYPTLGIDYYGLYVSCVMFRDDGLFLGNTVVAFDKTNMYNGSSSAFGYYWNNAVTIADGTTPAYRLAPATEEGVQDAEFLVATDAGYGFSSNITLCAWTNTSNIHTTSPWLTCGQNNTGQTYGDPIGARQPGTSSTVYPGFGVKQVYYKAGHLYLAQTTAFGTADGIFYAEIQPRLTTQAAHNPQWVNGLTVVQSAILSYGGYDSYMPMLMGDDENDVLLVNNVSNSSVNPSLVYIGRKATDVNDLWGQGSGVFVVVGSHNNTSGRWGDYSACAVPLNSVTRGGIWCGGEYAGSQASPGWNTRLYRIRMG